jgi:hypothetical protein
VAEVWAHLQRRDLLVEQSLTATLLGAWLETRRESEHFDEEYLAGVLAER